MKYNLKLERNKLNLVLAILLLVMVGLGCDKLTGRSLENTSWKGSFTDSASKQSFPIAIDLLPSGKAFVSITLPKATQPVGTTGTWTKGNDNSVSVIWGSGTVNNIYNATIKGDQMNGNINNPQGSLPLNLTKEKK